MRAEDIRREVRAWRGKQSADHLHKRSIVLWERLFSDPLWQSAKSILLYSSIDGEVDTSIACRRAIDESRTLYLPYCKPGFSLGFCSVNSLSDDLQRGAYGILEPLESRRGGKVSTPELIFVPALAYDRSGNRIGMGGGYYDRFLKDLKGVTAICGLAFSEQVYESLPVMAHDIAVDKLFIA